MSNEWAQMMATYGVGLAVAKNGSVDTADAGLLTSAQLVDLTHIAVLEITGEDAPAFLQGQFCNDLTATSATHAQITGYCTPKGRLLALPTVVGMDQGFRLLLPQSLKESFLKRLRMFVMRSAVTIEERPDWLCTGLIAAQDGTTGAAGDWLGALPGAPMDAATSATRQVIRWHDIPAGADGAEARPRYIVLCSESDQLALWAGSPQTLKRSADVWRHADIRAGVPTLSPAVSETFVPQMLNLQLIDALSFTKGCYPGQEIVARMQYLGKLKRHMRSFSLPASPDTAGVVVDAGDSLTCADDSDAGVVVDAVRDEQGVLSLLAVVKVSTNDAPVSIAGHVLSPLPLPYDLPSLTAPHADAG